MIDQPVKREDPVTASGNPREVANVRSHPLSFHVLKCESGGIGRRARLRIWYRKVWGFESPLSHYYE